MNYINIVHNSKSFMDFWDELFWKKVKFAQSCLTVCDHMDYSLLGFSAHGIFQERVPEWVAISFSRGSSQPRNWTQVSCIADRHFTLWATREALVQGWNLNWGENTRSKIQIEHSRVNRSKWKRSSVKKGG